MKNLLLLVLLLLVAQTSTYAESRERLAEIAASVDASGNFTFWKEGSPTLKALKEYVQDVTNPSSANYIPEVDRIATFDLDGTMLCETDPCQLCIAYALDMLGLGGDVPDPDKAVELLLQVIDGYPIPELKRTITDYVNRGTCQSFVDLKVGEAFYLPMLEVISYLRSNGFDVWIVSGSPREFSRIIASDVTLVPYSHIIGTDLTLTGREHADEYAHTYNIDADETMVICGLSNINVRTGKILNIYNSIGRRPILAFGNSDGDFSMFRYAVERDDDYLGKAFCVVPDDTQRELGDLETANALRSECEANGWTPISMKDDFATIYGYDQGLVEPTYIKSASNTSKHLSAYRPDATVATSATKGIIIDNNHNKVLKK